MTALESVLSSANAHVDVVAADKRRLLENLAGNAAARLGLDDRALAQEILNREALGSTGIGRGVAVPHARLPTLQRAWASLSLLRRPLDFEAIDGLPVDVVMLVLLPGESEVGNINVLAAVARRLRDDKAVEAIRRARTAPELANAFGSAGRDGGTSHPRE